MSKETKESKFEKYLKSAVQLLESKGYDEIKAAELPDYEDPTGFTQTSKDKSIQPDLTARTTLGKHYFEIVDKKSDNKTQKASEWKLFSKLAKIKNGKFFLLVPHGKMSYTRRVLAKNNIEAELMKLQLAK